MAATSSMTLNANANNRFSRALRSQELGGFRLGSSVNVQAGGNNSNGLNRNSSMRMGMSSSLNPFGSPLEEVLSDSSSDEEVEEEVDEKPNRGLDRKNSLTSLTDRRGLSPRVTKKLARKASFLSPSNGGFGSSTAASSSSSSSFSINSSKEFLAQLLETQRILYNVLKNHNALPTKEEPLLVIRRPPPPSAAAVVAAVSSSPSSGMNGSNATSSPLSAPSSNGNSNGGK